MLFIDDLKSLPAEHVHLFKPRPFSTSSNIQDLCVYAYLREEDDENGPKGSIYYVGEGASTRPSGKHRIHVPSSTNIWILSDRHEHKDETRYREALLIHYYGRIIDGTGILLNILYSRRLLLPWVPEKTQIKQIPDKSLSKTFPKEYQDGIFPRKMPSENIKKYIFDDIDLFEW